MMELIIAIFSFIICLLAKGFFSGTEIAVVSCNKIKLQNMAKKGHRGARIFMDLYKKPEVILTTTLIGTNLSTVAATTLGTLMVMAILPNYGDILALVIFVPLLLIIGEICPKSIFQQKADDFVPVLAFPLRAFVFLFRPISFLFAYIANLVSKWIIKSDRRLQLLYTREQLRSMIDTTEKSVDVKVMNKKRMLSAIRYGEMTVGEIMVPLHQVVLLDKNGSYEDFREIVLKHGHPYYPVYENNSSNIVGVLKIDFWDLCKHQGNKVQWHKTIKKSMFVTPKMRACDLLHDLMESDNQMAIVSDEYGSAIGIVKVEDIYSEIVGDVGSGYHFSRPRSKPEHTVEEIGDGEFQADTRMSLTEASDLIGIRLEMDGVYTIGGLITEVLKHIPKVGDKITWEDYVFEVVKANDKMPTKVHIRPSKRA